MTANQEQQAVGWNKSRQFIHLVAPARADMLGMPIIEDRYGQEGSLFGWITSDESHEPLNVWTKRFKDWYSQSTGAALIDHEISDAWQSLADEADKAYEACNVSGQCGDDEKEQILCALKHLESVAGLVRSDYSRKAEKLAQAICSASSSEEAEHQGDFEKHVGDLTNQVMADLKDYEGQFLQIHCE